VKVATSPRSFAESAVRAFPFACKALATSASETLAPFVDDGYRQGAIPLLVQGEQVLIPKRLQFLGAEQLSRTAAEALPVAQCLLTRSTNGHIRQAALHQILRASHPWAIPFIVLLAGEYVIEIIDDLRAALPSLDRPAYANFVRENRPALRDLRSRATSYWDRYYRQSYPDRGSYPGLVVLNHFDQWAA
jgi:hypothetical protein